MATAQQSSAVPLVNQDGINISTFPCKESQDMEEEPLMPSPLPTVSIALAELWAVFSSPGRLQPSVVSEVSSLELYSPSSEVLSKAALLLWGESKPTAKLPFLVSRAD